MEESEQHLCHTLAKLWAEGKVFKTSFSTSKLPLKVQKVVIISQVKIWISSIDPNRKPQLRPFFLALPHCSTFMQGNCDFWLCSFVFMDAKSYFWWYNGVMNILGLNQDSSYLIHTTGIHTGIHISIVADWLLLVI